jgi:ATP-dependent Clp protease adaptor protein ClpS
MDTKPQTKPEGETKQPWLWNVVVLNDDDHTFEYVIRMLCTLFGYTETKAFLTAHRIHTQGRAPVYTTHKELAELKRDQIIGFGPDVFASRAVGPLTTFIEPAEFDGADNEGNARDDEGAGKGGSENGGPAKPGA